MHANSANSLALSRTVQVNFTVPVNSAIHLHCSGDFLLFFFCSVYSFCIFFFLKKLVLHSHVNNIFFPEKLV